MNKIHEPLLEIYRDKEDLSNYAFSLYYFIEELSKELIKDEITDVFFLSREGKFLKLLYDNFSFSHSANVATHYMYISRKAVINATLEDLEHESFQDFKVYKRISITTFLESMNFSKDEIELVLCDNSNTGDEYEDFFHSQIFNELKHNKSFIKLYDEKRCESRNNIEKYLKIIGFTDAKKVAVVDVGWNGTIQNGLFRIKAHDRIHGYYIGCTEYEKSSMNEKRGLLFSSTSIFDPFYYNRYNMELICVANHGATDHYDEKGQPVLIADDDITLYDNYFHSIQDSILAKFKKIDEAISECNCSAEQLEYQIKYFHARMLLTLKKKNKNVIKYGVKKHPDNFIDIKFHHTIKVRVYAFLQLFAVAISAFKCLIKSNK